jgi:hypothetical protein
LEWLKVKILSSNPSTEKKKIGKKDGDGESNRKVASWLSWPEAV